MKLFYKTFFLSLFLSITFLFACYGQVNNGSSLYNQKKKENIKNQTTRILFIVDCSYSMYGKWQSDTKIKIVQSLLSNVIDSLKHKENIVFALRSFGNNKSFPQQDCFDSHLEIPFYENNSEALKEKIKTLVPKGASPIAFALKNAKNDFPENKLSRNIIIMIVDGMDDCGEDPCQESQKLQQEGKAIKPFIIGIGKGYGQHFACQNNYYEVDNEIEFSKKLNDIINLSIHNTTCQINLLDKFSLPTQTNVPIIFYEHKSKQPKYYFLHNVNDKFQTDTLEIDPLISYDVEIFSMPKISLNNVEVKAGEHTIINASLPQGTLQLKYKEGKNELKQNNIDILVRKPNEKQYVNRQKINSSQKYLEGVYDLDVLCLPPLYLENVEVEAASTTTIEIPIEGQLQLKQTNTYINKLFYKKEGQWIYFLDLESKKEQKLSLLPGEYLLICRKQKGDIGDKTIEEEFVIQSNLITQLKID
ncbi:MAG: VWA domain-containing protein [Bacteroidales bacterium]|jgi:Ca-activated chloride channel family protein|nr:VWA domain-containing protein [Bacteroidales bacterium]